jgi:hypothetical protein
MTKETEKESTVAEDVEEIRQIFGALSTEIPALIRSIINSVFSEEAGRNMGRAAAAFYKELKESGIPEEVAVKMTEDYVRVFTSLGDILKRVGKKEKVIISTKEGEEIGKEIEKLIKEKITEKLRGKTEKE